MSDRATPRERLCDSGAFSRTSHRARRWASLAAMVASMTRPSSKAVASVSCMMVCSGVSPLSSAMPLAGLLLPISISTFIAPRVASGCGISGKWWKTTCRISAGISSNASTPPPDAACKRCRSSTAADTSRTSANEVARATGCGNSFIVAAVITPSVPSEPTKRCRKS